MISARQFATYFDALEACPPGAVPLYDEMLLVWTVLLSDGMLLS